MEIYQNLGDVANAVLRGNFIAINIYFKKQVSNKQPNFIPQGSRKRRANETQSQWKEITKVTVEIQIKMTVQKFKLRAGSLKR